MLLLIWFPLIFRLPRGSQASALSLNPCLWHWLGMAGALFLISATALARRLRTGHHGARKSRTSASHHPAVRKKALIIPNGRRCYRATRH
jgi:hypothetical protein